MEGITPDQVDKRDFFVDEFFSDGKPKKNQTNSAENYWVHVSESIPDFVGPQDTFNNSFWIEHLNAGHSDGIKP